MITEIILREPEKELTLKDIEEGECFTFVDVFMGIFLKMDDYRLREETGRYDYLCVCLNDGTSGLYLDDTPVKKENAKVICIREGL